MKTSLIVCACATAVLTACEWWPVQPSPYNPPTAAPSRTPVVVAASATPNIVPPGPVTPTAVSAPLPETLTPAGPTEPLPTDTATPSPTALSDAMQVKILGCDTSFDVLHGMGEVTNAYVTLSNVGSQDLVIVCATLRGLDEGRPHPDKTKCMPSIPAGYQVTLKLTVDTTSGQQTPIQVDVTTAGNLLARAGEPACKAVGLLLPSVVELGVLTPVPPAP